MKTTIKTGFAIVIIASAILASCGKYEEGPKFSLASKKGRVANEWKVDKYFQDGVDKTGDYRLVVESETYDYKKDGTYTLTQKFTSLGGNQTYNESGTWEFINKNEDLKSLSSQSGATADTMHITRLKSNEMWVKSVSGSPVQELHMISK
mgnify:CR=1 FL=1